MRIILFVIILVFYIGDNVLTKYDISLSLHKAVLLLLCCIILFKVRYARIVANKAFPLLYFLLSYTVFKIVSGGNTGNTMMGIIVILPVSIYILFRTIMRKCNVNKVKKILYLSYICECIIAFLERILHFHIFQLGIGDNIISMTDSTITEFRSIGLYGHPLQNALVVLVFINYILLYEKNIKHKFILAFLGIVAIFCFNTRAAIVMSCLSLVIYTCYWLIYGQVPKYKKNLALFLLVVMAGGLYNLFSLGLIGGRLSSMGLYDDDSAAVRVAVFDIFNYYKLSDFITGISIDQLAYLKYRTGLYAIENFWLNWILSYGVLFVVGLLILYIPFLRQILKKETSFRKFFLLIPFIVLASTNPSLAVSIVPMTAFLLLSYIMPNTYTNEKNFHNNSGI